jgi:hypothetical protein
VPGGSALFTVKGFFNDGYTNYPANAPLSWYHNGQLVVVPGNPPGTSLAIDDITSTNEGEYEAVIGSHRVLGPDLNYVAIGPFATSTVARLVIVTNPASARLDLARSTPPLANLTN